MWIRKEAVIFDRDSEAEKFKKETIEEKPLSWSEFRVLQSSKSKDLVSQFVGDKDSYRATGIKINRQQLVAMSGHEFRGEIACYSIWIANNTVTGPITDAMQGYNPPRNQISAYDLENNLPEFYQLRSLGGQLVTQYEHLASTWDCLIADNEPERQIGAITPETVTAQMELKLRMTSEEAKGADTFKKRLKLIENENFTGYNPSMDFIDNVALLIW